MKGPSITKDRLILWLLRIGLAVVFGYAGISSLLHPTEWVGFLPSFLAKLPGALSLLKGFAIFEILLAVWLLSGRVVRYGALVAALLLAGIIVAQPSDLIITFRDAGLLFMALALAVAS